MDKYDVVNSHIAYLYNLDYKEIPVDIMTFISSSEFLGSMLGKGKLVYKPWVDMLLDVMTEDTILEVVLTGAIGTGKTYGSTIGIAYTMYRVMCLRDPWGYFGLADGGKMSVVFFNLTKSLSDSGSYATLQNFILNSPWFLKHGSIRGRENTYLDIPLFQYKLGSPYARGFGTLGNNVIAASMDEIDNSSDSAKQKDKLIKAYEETVRRFKSRFVVNEETLGKFFLSSSKQDGASFLNIFIKQRQNSKHVYVCDVALYEAKPKNYSGETFSVMVGDSFVPSKILDYEQDVMKALTDGHKVIQVPVEHREDYINDIVGALRDISGVSVEGSRRFKLFASELFLKECYDEDKVDPIEMMTVTTGLQDPVPLIKHINLDAIRTSRGTPRYIHMDIAFSGNGDAMGLSMAGVSGWKTAMVEHEDGSFTKQKVPIVETDFVMRLKARPGDEIPIHKCRKLVLDLRSAGFNIKLFSADLKLASADTTQILEKAGIATKYISLDRTPEYYNIFRDLVFEKRWICHEHEYLHFEYKNLEKDRASGKVDHPDKVEEIVFMDDGSAQEYIMLGSKDIADACTGAVVSAIKDVETPPDTDALLNMMDKAVEATIEEDIYHNLIDRRYVSGDDKKAREDKVVDEGMKTFKSLFNKVL